MDDGHACVFTIPLHGRLCQVLNLDPRPVLIAEVLFSNIGGTGTGRCRCVCVCMCVYVCVCVFLCVSFIIHVPCTYIFMWLISYVHVKCMVWCCYSSRQFGKEIQTISASYYGVPYLHVQCFCICITYPILDPSTIQLHR